MDEISGKLTRLLMIFVGAVVLFKITSTTEIFQGKQYKGKGYAVTTPDGWRRVREDKTIYRPEGVEEVVFVPKEVVTPVGWRPTEPYISIRTEKLKSPMWIEDEWPTIVASLQAAGNQVKDKGEIKMDDQISEWVLYLSAKKKTVVLEFHMITESSVYYKIQFTTRPEDFSVLRPSFEQLRGSFKFRFSLY